MSEFHPGDVVLYRPYPGATPEEGVVTRLSNDPSLVFVKYAGQHPDARGQATPTIRLERRVP